jgi:folate-binding protein YgfZ
VDARRLILMAYKQESLIVQRRVHSLPARPLTDWQLIDIQQGIATITPSTTAMFTPHQLNYQLIGAISFNKGCYRGQEIIARTHYLGKLKQRLHLATIRSEQPITPGMELTGGHNQIVGHIVNSIKADNNQYQVLATVYTAAKEQNQVLVHLPSGKLPLQFLALNN